MGTGGGGEWVGEGIWRGSLGGTSVTAAARAVAE